jgi:hypothetical protein
LVSPSGLQVPKPPLAPCREAQGRGRKDKKNRIRNNTKQTLTMKKTYIAPSVEVIKVGAISMLAASMGINDKEVDTETDQLGREDNTPSSPNLWDLGW